MFLQQGGTEAGSDALPSVARPKRKRTRKRTQNYYDKEAERGRRRLKVLKGRNIVNHVDQV